MRSRYLVLGLLVALAAGCHPAYPKGEALYLHKCSACHMDDGSGLAGLIPPLNEPGFLTSKVGDLPCIIRYGIHGPIRVGDRTFDQPMAALPELSEIDLANLMNYLLNRWGGGQPFISPGFVRNALKNCSPSALPPFPDASGAIDISQEK